MPATLGKVEYELRLIDKVNGESILLGSLDVALPVNAEGQEQAFEDALAKVRRGADAFRAVCEAD